jgi:predicted XRE-type DNA-binding protein
MAKKAEPKEVEREEIAVERGSGNVYEDLGYPTAESLLQKSKRVVALSAVFAAKGLSQTAAASLVGVDQPTLSKLLRGRTRSFSLDRLFGILTMLDQDVEISVRPRPSEVSRPARVSVVVAHVI